MQQGARGSWGARRGCALLCRRLGRGGEWSRGRRRGALAQVHVVDVHAARAAVLPGVFHVGLLVKGHLVLVALLLVLRALLPALALRAPARLLNRRLRKRAPHRHTSWLHKVLCARPPAA